MSSDLESIVAMAREPSEHLDALITASMNNAHLVRYPPTDDFGGGRSRWQFWSVDRKHFLGNESRFPIFPYTSDLSTAMLLVPEQYSISINISKRHSAWSGVVTVGNGPVLEETRHMGTMADVMNNLPLAVCRAALRARNDDTEAS